MKRQLMAILIAGMVISAVPAAGDSRRIFAADINTADTAVTADTDADTDTGADANTSGTVASAGTDSTDNTAAGADISDAANASSASGASAESAAVESTEKSVDYYAVDPTPDNEAQRRQYAAARTYTPNWQMYGYDKSLGRYTSWVYMKADGTYPRNTNYTVDGVTCHFNANAEATGWFIAYGNIYYAGSDGKIVTGTHTIGGKNYTFSDRGVLEEGTVVIGGRTYTKGTPEKKEETEKFGWESRNGKRYFAVNGKELKNTWAEIDGSYYYFNGDGTVHTGGLYKNSRWYNFGSDGKQFLNTWIRWKGKTYYYAGTDNKSGTRQTIRSYSTSKKTVCDAAFYTSYGARLYGQQTVGGKLYNFGSDGNRVTLSFYKNGSRKYFASADGSALKNTWAKIDGNYYYFNSDGTAHTGGLYKNAGWYNFGSDGKQFLNTWVRWKGKTYYYAGTDNKSGTRQTVRSYSTGRRTVSNVVFYASYGQRVTGKRTINGRVYNFAKDGSLITASGKSKSGKKGTAAKTSVSVTDAMDRKAQSYKSSTSYLILVNRSTHKVGVYKGKRNAWKNVKKFACGDGKKSTPTIEGTFTVGIKLRYFNSGRARCWYATQFRGNYLFHSVLYDQSSTPRRILDGRTGVGVSHGCVRLQLSNAKWIYDNIPARTTVVVYH